ncbi:hypothetical protein C2U72_21910 [Prosthecomicrobium hirschii]|nr:hypothetical protein C2U72_21910 [Prosthecomicrobium hirschii]
MLSAPVPPSIVSLPPLAVRVSLPAPPFRELSASLPVIALARSLPMPLIAVVPVSTRFST